MHLFSDYIQPIIGWMQLHPHWALFFAFIISFAESLVIVGSIVPGSVTMTAIGILAGSGVMRIDLTLLMATLGAIAGDGISYILGYTYSDKLNAMWPFRRNPKWLDYGKDYFTKHGGKSILIGRFVGPLRSVIPVIAGMMHMNHVRFFSANAISAIAWSLVYVLPGIIIGAASNELSPESATRLFASVLIFLGSLWLVTIVLKWLIIHANRFLRLQFHDLWSWSRKRPLLGKLITTLTPNHEQSHQKTAMLCLGFLLSTFAFFLITFLLLQENFALHINQPIYLLLQSLRLYTFDVFFIFISGFINQFTLLTLSIVILLVAIYYREWRTLSYWVSLNLTCAITLLLFYLFIKTPSLSNVLDIQSESTYPALQLVFATAQFSALLFYLNRACKCRFNVFLNVCLPIILLLGGVASLYLGDSGLMDIIGAYFCGFSLSLLHWILYRRKKNTLYQPCLAPLITFSIVLLTTLSVFFNIEQSLRIHQPYLAQYVFTDAVWWNQNKPLLPTYRTNRVGKKISLFNIQYAGTLSHFETTLAIHGWHKETESLFKSILKKINHQNIQQDSPLMSPLYLNRKSVLTMTYQPPNGQQEQIIRLWRSNYHLKHFLQPIWLGTVNVYSYPKNTTNKSTMSFISSLHYIAQALPEFSKRLTHDEPKILLIKEVVPLKTGL